MDHTTAFSPNYATARQRFRDAASRLGWTLEAHPVGGLGPGGEQLTVDVALAPESGSHKAVVVSSGVHGVEGFLGSAVQVALLERWATEPPRPLRYVFLHGLNPFGFAWLRRFDENNVDLNRNFLLPGESYAGAPPGYAELDPLLNPRRAPARWEPFLIKALWTVVRRGMPELRQAIAAGQYEFPRGLFFGGSEPAGGHRLLSEHLRRWLQGAAHVVHLDFHTGLGHSGDCKLLIDYPLSDSQRTRLADWFGPESFEAASSSGISYAMRGGFGQWCVNKHLAADYLYACVEFGTYGPLRVVAGLRTENQAHHWGSPSAASTQRAKQRLKELFCPAARSWRSKTVDHSLAIVERAGRGLSELS